METDVPAVQVRGLRKNYGATAAVSGIDLDIAPGSVFALLGPNGAGKPVTALRAGPAQDGRHADLRIAEREAPAGRIK